MAIVTVLSLATTLSATTIHVPAEQPTIQAGIDAAIDGDTVLVSPGVYAGDGNTSLHFNGKKVIVRSLSGAQNTSIDGQGGAGRILFISGEDSASVLDGFTVEDFLPLNYGVILCSGSSPIIRNCTFRNIRNYGGHIFGGWGGAIYAENASPTVENCQFFHNETGNTPSWGSWAGGSGIFCINSTPEITRCIFVGNSISGGGRGSALRFDQSLPVLSYCTISGNAHLEQIYLIDSDPTFYNCIIAFGEGVSIACEDTASQPVLVCSDVYGNQGGDWVGYISGQIGQAMNLEADPLFCDTAAEQYGLQGSSPCSPGSSPCGELIGALGVACQCCSQRGDINSDAELSIADLTYFVSYSFKTGPAPDCLEDADCDGNASVDIADLTFLVSYMFKSGAEPASCPQ